MWHSLAMKSERSEISIHEVKVYQLLFGASEEWFTNADISKKLAMKPRTVRLHTLRLVKLGVLDQAEVFPAHRYRWSKNAKKRNLAYFQRLEEAATVFGDLK